MKLYKLHQKRKSHNRSDFFIHIVQKADIAVAPLTISYERQHFVDFTKPFMDLGLIILMAKEAPRVDRLAFLEPFEWRLWLAVFGAFLASALLTTIFRLVYYDN